MSTLEKFWNTSTGRKLQAEAADATAAQRVDAFAAIEAIDADHASKWPAAAKAVTRTAAALVKAREALEQANSDNAKARCEKIAIDQRADQARHPHLQTLRETADPAIRDLSIALSARYPLQAREVEAIETTAKNSEILRVAIAELDELWREPLNIEQLTERLAKIRARVSFLNL